MNTFPVLEHARADFLLPNRTSKVQLLDASIIAFVKNRYRLRLLFRVFDNMYIVRKSNYSIYVLTAMR